MSDHARLSPSDKSWPYCPGSPRENAAYPDIPGEAAIDGTGSHLLLELCLTNSVRAEDYLEQFIGVNHEEKPGGWLVDLDRAKRVQECLDYVARRYKELSDHYFGCKVELFAESRSNPGKLVDRDDWYGTCDITLTVINPHGRCVYLEVIDYKDGRGWVDEKDNTQTQAYLIGKLAPYIADANEQGYVLDLDTRQAIVQPKCSPSVRYVDASYTDIMPLIEWFGERALATDDPEAPLIPDDHGGKGHCLWCKHGRAKNCSALNDKLLQKANVIDTVEIIDASEDAKGLFDLLSGSSEKIKTLDNDQLAKLYDSQPAIQQIFTLVSEELERRVRGGGVDGFMIGHGNTSKVWAFDEETIAKKLKGMRLNLDDIYPRKMISPAQAVKHEKLTAAQRTRVEKDLIVLKAGSEKLQRVTFEKKQLSKEDMFSPITKPQQLTDETKPEPVNLDTIDFM
jgi:hypothetical protein